MFCRGSVWRRGWAASGKPPPTPTLLGFQDGCPGSRRHRNTALCCPRVSSLGTAPRGPVSASPGRCTSPIWTARLTLHCLLAQRSPGPGSSWGLAVTLIRGRPRVEGLWSQISQPGALFWRCHYVARRMVVGAPRGVHMCFLVSRRSPRPDLHRVACRPCRITPTAPAGKGRLGEGQLGSPSGAPAALSGAARAQLLVG